MKCLLKTFWPQNSSAQRSSAELMPMRALTSVNAFWVFSMSRSEPVLKLLM